MKNTIIVFITLLLIILVQSYVIISKNRNPEVEKFDDSSLRRQIEIKDSIITYWKNQSDKWVTIALNAELKSDSLEQLKPIIKHHYHEVYKTIADGTIVELDSIIRASW